MSEFGLRFALGHAEDSMFASIVNLDLFAVVDCQSSSAGENCILNVILCARLR
jgi:hypothetical protein